MKSPQLKWSVPLVGLTGSIGSGKTAVAEIFRSLGAEIIDADILAREVVVPGSEGLEEIVAEFGKNVLSKNGTLDRRALGAVVFPAPDKLKKLEAITHPKIRRLFKAKLKRSLSSPNLPKMIVYVVPLMFESGVKYEEIDYIVVVSAPREVCLKRIMARDKLNELEAELRYDRQLPIEIKEAKADFVIKNTSDLQSLERATKETFDAIVAR